jgi:undecaprenyl-diphosphatase
MKIRVPLRLPLAAACAFLLLTVLVIADWRPLAAADTAISEWFRRLGDDNPGMIAVVRVATDVAATIPFLAAGVLLTLFLTVRGERRPARFTAIVTVVVPVVWSLMHWGLLDPRPENGFVTVASSGFPSGHTSNAAAAALVAVYLLGGWRSRVVVVGAVVFAVLVGVSRLVLLAHWPSQVLGGWLLGLAVVPVVAYFTLGVNAGAPLRPISRKPASPS